MRIKGNLTAQILIGVALGALVGGLARGHDLAALSGAGKMIIHWVKLVAGPFLFFSILTALMRVSVGWGQGARLLLVAGGNAVCALLIAVVLTLGLLGGYENAIGLWKRDAAAGPPAEGPMIVPPAAVAPPPVAGDIGFEAWLKSFQPVSLFEPFACNEILLIALLALILGVAARSTFQREQPEVLAAWARGAERLRELLARVLHWITRLIPFAVFAVLAGAIAQYGFGIFATLAPFVLAVLLGFALQVFVVYGFWIAVVARMRPRDFWRESKQTILYAFGVNSSLASLPYTLESLRRMKVSDSSASLGAGVGTNLNNDGILLYEAMAVYFTAIVLGMPMDVPQMIGAALVCIVAAMGITGIPEAGFISLTVVIGLLKLPTELLPLLLSIDWMIARFRSAVNVTSDMTLSIALDAVSGRRDWEKG